MLAIKIIITISVIWFSSECIYSYVIYCYTVHLNNVIELWRVFVFSVISGILSKISEIQGSDLHHQNLLNIKKIWIALLRLTKLTEWWCHLHTFSLVREGTFFNFLLIYIYFLMCTGGNQRERHCCPWCGEEICCKVARGKDCPQDLCPGRACMHGICRYSKQLQTNS